MPDSVFIERRGEIAHLILNRPEKRNALNLDMWQRLEVCVDELADDSQVRVVIVRGVDETAFAAGADISEFDTIYATPASTEAYRQVLISALRKLAELAKPVIASIQGPCVGGGCGIALSCDIRLAGATAGLGITPAKLGVVYSLWDTKRLVDVVGPSQAKHILFSGQILPASEALRIGLVDQVFDDDNLGEEVDRYAEGLTENSLRSQQAAKMFIEMIREGVVHETDVTRKMNREGFQQEDFIEGRTAFMEKRKPNFPYRG